MEPQRESMSRQISPSKSSLYISVTQISFFILRMSPRLCLRLEYFGHCFLSFVLIRRMNEVGLRAALDTVGAL
jgi:hypothetical protein